MGAPFRTFASMEDCANNKYRIRAHHGRIKRKVGIMWIKGSMKVSAAGLECTSGEGSVMGMQIPVKMGPMHFSLASIARVSYVGLGGLMFSVRVGREEYMFEARSNMERNIWVCTIEQWLRNPTGWVSQKKSTVKASAKPQADAASNSSAPSDSATAPPSPPPPSRPKEVQQAGGDVRHAEDDSEWVAAGGEELIEGALAQEWLDREWTTVDITSTETDNFVELDINAIITAC